MSIDSFFTNIWNAISNSFYQFIGVMRGFQLKDLIDILVVAYLIYKLIQIVRQTRAKQLLGGIVAVLLAWLLASLFEMTTMTVILRAVVDAGLIALVIIFQPELRNALELVSLTKFRRLGRKAGEVSSEAVVCIDNICKACGEMSLKKTGALIVIERDTMLGDIIKTGTIVDAQANPEVICNVFYPKAPLHDGAMIVRNNRVYAAGCILPLTQNMSISKELGTRHRASLGMSENSDAIVVVVSEETGVISVAREGELKRGFTPKELGDYLKSSLIQEETPAESRLSKIKNKFRKGGDKTDE